MRDIQDILEDITSRLERLGSIQIVGGKNISVAEIDSKIIISMKDDTDFSPGFKRWMLDMQRRIDTLPEFESGDGVVIEHNPGHVRISSLIEAQASGRGQSAPSSAETLYFPFRTIYDSTSAMVVVTGYNPSAKRYYRNLAAMGFYSPVEVAEASFEPLSGWIYLKISYSSGSFGAVLHSASELPSQSESEFIVPIASVHIDENLSVSVSQVQFGNVVIPGRVV